MPEGPSAHRDIGFAMKTLKEFLIGDRRTIAGTVYGTIVVLAVLAAGASAYRDHLWRLDLIAAGSTLVLWMAHVYSDGLGESLNLGRRLTPIELSHIARREYSIVAAAVLPLAAITLGAIHVLPPGTAVFVAFAVGVVTLTAQGIRYARLENLSPPAAALTVSLNLAAGLALVALEAVVSH
jgi:hypothetical protein